MIVAVWGSCGRGYLTDGNCLLHGRMNSSPSLVSMGDGRPDRLSHEYRLFNTTEYRRVFFYFHFFFLFLTEFTVVRIILLFVHRSPKMGMSTLYLFFTRFSFRFFFSFDFVVGAGDRKTTDGHSPSGRRRDGTGTAMETAPSAQATAATPTTVGQWRFRTGYVHADWAGGFVIHRSASATATAIVATFHAQSAAATTRRFRHSHSSVSSQSAGRTHRYWAEFHSSRPATSSPAAHWTTTCSLDGHPNQ